MRAAGRFSLFDYGFRPFFLLGGLFAMVMIPAWIIRLVHPAASFGALPVMYWHAHEMLYGFVMAAIAGFLLTAVPNWTGTRGFGGRTLIVAVAVWLAGRVAISAANGIPGWLLVLAELSFVPLLIALLAPPILRVRNRNVPILVVLLVFWVVDGVFVTGMLRSDVLLAAGALRLGIDLALILITVIGGRIVPVFTANALHRRGETVNISARKSVEIATISVMVAVAVAEVLAPNGWLSGALAGAAAVCHFVRLLGWKSFRTRGEPILWVLHLGYAWLPVGFALKAFALLAEAAWAAKWQHALTVGATSTMILAVMTRVSLGHTGRPLTVSRAIAAAYLLLTLGALVRTFGGVLTPTNYLATLYVAALCWVLSFGIFVVVYAPILCRPRPDGKPG